MNSQQRYEQKKLAQASVLTGNELIYLVDFVESKFNTNRTKATLAVGALIQSLKYQLENDEQAQIGVLEIINDLEVHVQN